MFDKELAYFNEQKEYILQHHENRFVLIKGAELIGSFATEAEAYKAGIEKFGNVPFFIKQAMRNEPQVFMPGVNFGTK